MKRALSLSVAWLAALLVSHEAAAQVGRPRAPMGGGGTATPPALPAPASGPAGAEGSAPAPSGTAAGGIKPGDASAGGFPQFEPGVDFAPKSDAYKVALSLEDADLPELVRVIGQLTGKRFIFGGKVRTIEATVFSPEKVTVAEAYQAFLSILDSNGLTVVPHGRFLKIVETGGIAGHDTPLYTGGAEGAPPEDRYVTRIHRLGHVSAEEIAALLGHLKSKDADITVYAPGNLLIIITDTGSNIERMMQIVEEVDVGTAGDQIWIEPIDYGSATDIEARLGELFDVKGGSSAAGAAGGKPARQPASETHISKLVADADELARDRLDRARVPSHARDHQAARRPAAGGGGDPRRRAPACRCGRADQDPAGDHHRGGRGDRAGWAASPGQARDAGGRELRGRNQGQRRQGDQLDRRDLLPAGLRLAARSRRQARPTAQAGLHRRGGHGPVHPALRHPRVQLPRRGPGARDVGGQLAAVRRPEPPEDDPPPRSLDAERPRPRYPRARHPGFGEPAWHGPHHPGVRRRHQRSRERQRRRRPLHAAHPRDGQHRRRDQRRRERALAAERRPDVARTGRRSGRGSGRDRRSWLGRARFLAAAGRART